MDDWSNLPSRQAVSEPAPNPTATLTTTPYLNARLSLPRQAPPRRPSPAAHSARRLTQQASPGSTATKPGQSPETPFHNRPIPVDHPHRQRRRTSNGQTGLDIHRPFMDDNTGPIPNLTN